ncbi:unnamed protein product [Cylindrotheca closterium]|uniref:Uncharacterized protein n=1 Tax=Cylindrotheca closterium TaxID=2856 RepID=A0AAD2CIR8_9STRA|nr:unnamed protein product [Cylindrotheca closterium]
MPIREIVNALFLTYVGTEWMLQSSNELGKHQHDSFQVFLRILQNNKLFVALVSFLNIVDTFKRILPSLEGLWQLRILLAATAYVFALYVDCKRKLPSLELSSFLRQVAMAFLKVLPIYPFLAVLISFVFLFVISIFETLHLPLELLNMPIYYGTLYGPFSYIYYIVKRQVIESTTSLPTNNMAAGEMTAYFAR